MSSAAGVTAPGAATGRPALWKLMLGAAALATVGTTYAVYRSYQSRSKPQQLTPSNAADSAIDSKSTTATVTVHSDEIDDIDDADSKTGSNAAANPSGALLAACYEKMLLANRLVLVNSESECNAAVARLLADSTDDLLVLGFDMEWVSQPTEQPIALLQLSSLRTTLLIRLRIRNGSDSSSHSQSALASTTKGGSISTFAIPASLRAILEDSKYLKVGVAISDDAKRLSRDCGVAMRGYVDVSALYSRTSAPVMLPNPAVPATTTATTTIVAPSATATPLASTSGVATTATSAATSVVVANQSFSLQRLAKLVLNVNLLKDSRIRCSDWETPRLSAQQMWYAAADSWYGREIFVKLFELKRAQRQTLQWTSESLHGWCAGLIDVRYRPNGGNRSSTAGSSSADSKRSSIALDSASSDGDSKNASLREIEAIGTHAAKKAARIARQDRNPMRKRDLYENARMYNTNGVLLAMVDRKRINWYLKRGLAELISEEPLSVKLLFEPKANGNAFIPDSENNAVDEKTSQFYLTNFDNLCVVCGVKEGLRCHSVVPRGLRQHFPIIYKSRSSHDILLLCGQCSLRLEQLNDQLVVQICRENNVRPPYNHWTATEKAEFEELKLVNKSLMGLTRHLSGRFKLPAARVTELENLARTALKLPKDAPIGLAEIKRAEQKLPPLDRHYEDLCKIFIAKDQIMDICKRWRQHFLEHMHPQHLSPHWSVDHFKIQNEERLREQEARRVAGRVAKLAAVEQERQIKGLPAPRQSNAAKRRQQKKLERQLASVASSSASSTAASSGTSSPMMSSTAVSATTPVIGLAALSATPTPTTPLTPATPPTAAAPIDTATAPALPPAASK